MNGSGTLRDGRELLQLLRETLEGHAATVATAVCAGNERGAKQASRRLEAAGSDEYCASDFTGPECEHTIWPPTLGPGEPPVVIVVQDECGLHANEPSQASARIEKTRKSLPARLTKQ